MSSATIRVVAESIELEAVLQLLDHFMVAAPRDCGGSNSHSALIAGDRSSRRIPQSSSPVSPLGSGRDLSGTPVPGFFFRAPRIDAGRFCGPGYLAEWLRAVNRELRT